MQFHIRGLALSLALFNLGASQALAQAQQHADHALGTVNFPVSCTPTGQREFIHAVALLHHMTYPQAREAFQQAVAADPKCAMAHWGIAMTLFQPLWPTRPSPEALQRGWDEVQKARALQPASKRERMFIDSAEAFFLEPASTDYWLRIRRWEVATENTYAAFPQDPEAAVFYALAHLATTPSDRIDRSHADRAAAILLRVYGENPDHPGAMHYLVHANDVPGRERESLEITRKYDAAAPRNPHALHMPTHIYTRLGDWPAVIDGNLRAAEAALEHPAGERRQYVWDEFAHAIEYLVYAYLQQGNDSKALEQLQRLRNTPSLEPSFKTAFHLASTQARYALERRDWNQATEIIARQPPGLDWDKYAWAEGIAIFAQGLGAARTGKLTQSTANVERLRTLEASMEKTGEKLFARNLHVMRLALESAIARANGQKDESVARLQEAAELEAETPKHAVTPGPTLPAYEQLGDLLLEYGEPARASWAYQKSMEFYPRRFNSLLGAARAARTSGDAAQARRYYSELLDVAGDGTRVGEMAEARRAVDGR